MCRQGSYIHDSQQKKLPTCTFCKGNHKANNCNVVVDHKERLAIVKCDNLCFNCLAKHRASQCNSRFTCKECKKHHHTSLCQSFPSNSEQTQASPQSTTTTQTDQTSGYNYGFYPHFSLPCQCLLADDRNRQSVIITIAEGHILFDEGAQRSFIMQQLADKLHLQPTSHETISVSSFGAQVSPSRTLATMFVHALDGTRLEISDLIVPKLAVPIQNSVRTHLHTVPYLKSLPLAHPVTGDENFDISILIRADYYWQLIEDHTVRGNGPTAVKSKLGYLPSGPLQLPQPMTTSGLHVAIFHSTSYPIHDHGSQIPALMNTCRIPFSSST